MSTCVGADFFERENSEIVDEEAARQAYPNRTSERLSDVSRRSAEEPATSSRGRHAAPKRGVRPSPGGSTGASRLGEARGESSTLYLVLRDQTVTVFLAARGRRGPRSIPGRPPKRPGPSRTVRPGVARGLLGPKPAEGSPKRPDVETATRFDRGLLASGLSLNRSEERVSRAALQSPVRERSA